jgi:hypothetical protein
LCRIKALATQLNSNFLSGACGNNAAGHVDQLLDDRKPDACHRECQEALCPGCWKPADSFGFAADGIDCRLEREWRQDGDSGTDSLKCDERDQGTGMFSGCICD